MFDHVEFSVRSFQRSIDFYESFLPLLGYETKFRDNKGKEAGFGAGEATEFLLYEAGQLKPPMHFAFKASSKIQVDEFYKNALLNNGKCNGGPGFRKDYGAGYYAAFVIDPDGHNVEALFRESKKH